MIVVKLNSGAELKITVCPFVESKELLDAILEEVKNLKLDPEQNIDVNFFKDLFCSGFSSKKIMEKVTVCMNRSLYNDLKIDKNTFEDLDARGDYLEVLYHIALENIRPFTKSLYAMYSPILEKLKQNHV